MTGRTNLPLPAFFEPNNAESHAYRPDQQRLFSAAADWRKAHRITPSATDERNIHLLLIDVQGAKTVKKTKPDAVFIFLAPPSKEELKRRLIRRGTESRKEIERRYRVATRELKELNDLKLCDYRIVNREIPVAREVLEAIIRAERLSTHKRSR